MYVEIDGTRYDCVSSITPDIEYTYFHDVVTMDGTMHKLRGGKRTNYNVVFYNINPEQYEQLKADSQNWNDVVTLTVPHGVNGTLTAEYYVETSGDTFKGVLYDGKNYFTGMSMFFAKKTYDEV